MKKYDPHRTGFEVWQQGCDAGREGVKETPTPRYFANLYGETGWACQALARAWLNGWRYGQSQRDQPPQA